MSSILIAIAALAIGALVTVLAFERRRREDVASLPDREEESKRLEELVARATAQLSATAGQELQKTSEHLMQVNKQQRGAEQETAAESFNRRKQEFESLTKPIEKALKQVEGEVESLAKQRTETDAVLMDQIKGLGDQTERLGQALRNPKSRGDWGEVQLRRLVELAGMTEHVDFDLQKEIRGSETRLRPDMVVLLPGGRRVIVDSKVALDALEDSQQAESDADRSASLRKLASAIRAQVKSLASKDYHGQFEAGQSPDFVICHIRVEAALFGALEVEPGLYEEALALGVVISTPLTLVALLRTIELGWRTERMAVEAKKIAEAGRDLHKRSAVFLAHFGRVGKNLDQAVGAYNDAVGSAERNLLPKLRQIEVLGAESGKSLDEPPRVERSAKPIVAEELLEIEATGNSEGPAVERPAAARPEAA
ncbi:MAG TPA: DNA recombination protein RmuC [Solirubrobacterales bacterium]|nr:DNA recombination protein RmuC [Solirubrobacterales bacterium]